MKLSEKMLKLSRNSKFGSQTWQSDSQGHDLETNRAKSAKKNSKKFLIAPPLGATTWKGT